MSDENFIQLLRAARVPKGTGNERHYLEARRWAGTVAGDQGDYERLVQAAAKYVGV